MQFSDTRTRNIAYGVLGLVAIVLMVSSFSIKNNIINSVFGVKNMDVFENSKSQEGFSNRKNVKEGFSLNDNDNDNSINECILRKIKALESELGNSDDHNKIKEILKNAKKACDYDATKCIINLIKKNTGPTSLNLDDMFNDKDKDCIHYKNCTELSKDLTTMIDNIGRR